jgi:hypothetical protein
MTRSRISARKARRSLRKTPGRGSWTRTRAGASLCLSLSWIKSFLIQASMSMMNVKTRRMTMELLTRRNYLHSFAVDTFVMTVYDKACCLAQVEEKLL